MRLSELIRSDRKKTRGPRTEHGLPSARGLGESEVKMEGREWRRNSGGKKGSVRAITHVEGAERPGTCDPSDLAATKLKLLPFSKSFFEYSNSI